MLPDYSLLCVLFCFAGVILTLIGTLTTIKPANTRQHMVRYGISGEPCKSRVCGYSIFFQTVFATLLQQAFPKKYFATDGIVPAGFGISAVFEAFIMVYYCLVLIFAPGYSSGPPPVRCPAKRIVSRTAAIPPPAGSVHQWHRAFSCFL